MALQMATNITPDVFSGVGGAVFDAEDGLTVRWQVNGTPYLLAYEITLHEVDDNSTQVYDTGKVVLESPFYGVLANGDVQMFTANTIPAEELASAGVVNGKEYQMYITQWWGDTDEMSVTSQSPAVITPLGAPTVEIDEYETINSRMHTFTATYTQAQNVQIAWVRWRLYDRSRNDVLLDDTGEIYGTAQLAYTHTAFFTDTIYGIEVTLETQAGQQATSGIQTIYVSYNTGAADGQVTAMQECGWNGVKVEWDSAKNMMGRVTGEYLFTDNDELTLNAQSVVTWTQKSGEAIRFTPPYSVVWAGASTGLGARSTTMPTVLSFATTAGEMSLQAASVGSPASASLYAANALVGTVTVSGVTVEQGDLLYVLFSPTELTLTVKKGDGSGTQSASVNITYTQNAITTVRLQGPQTCENLWIEEGTVNGPIDPETYAPLYTTDTYFLTMFENQDLNAGNSDTTGYAVYRLDNTTGDYMQVATLEVNQTGIIDYGARNGHSYTYQIWYMSDTIFTRLPLTSNEVTPCRWNVLLMATMPDEEGVYHPQAVYAFGANVETSEVSNNNKSAKQDTFTHYPAYQRSNSLYRTGKLTALIGKIDPSTNQYVNDTSDYADEIMRLSVSDMTLFMRDRKGNFRLVQIDGAMSQRIKDPWPNQAVTVTIPWVEVGDTSQMSVILDNSDALWPYDQVFDTTVWVDLATGHLMWETTADYEPNVRGSVLDVTTTGRLTQELESTEVEMADMSINEYYHLIAEQ